MTLPNLERCVSVLICMNIYNLWQGEQGVLEYLCFGLGWVSVGNKYHLCAILNFAGHVSSPFIFYRIKSNSVNHALSNLTLPSFGSFKPIGVCLEVHQSLVDFLLCIEHERSILYDFLIEWETSDENCLIVSICLIEYLSNQRQRRIEKMKSMLIGVGCVANGFCR